MSAGAASRWGAGIGVFFGLLTPLPQMPVSVAMAVALRANLPAASGAAARHAGAPQRLKQRDVSGVTSPVTA
jgi:hypothetical protein